MKEPTIQVEVRRLKKMVQENRRLSRENDFLRRRIEELEHEVRRLAAIWGEDPTAPGVPEKK